MLNRFARFRPFVKPCLDASVSKGIDARTRRSFLLVQATSMGLSTKETVRALLTVGQVYAQGRDPGRALPFFEQAVALADKDQAFECLELCARGYERQKRFPIVAQLLEKAVGVMQAESHIDPAVRLDVMQRLGLAYAATGREELAVERMNAVVEGWEARVDELSRLNVHKRLIAEAQSEWGHAWNVRGRVMSDLRRLEDAVESHVRAREVFQARRPRVVAHVATTLQLLAAAQFDAGMATQAKQTINKALDSLHRVHKKNDHLSIVGAHRLAAKMHLTNGQVAVAARHKRMELDMVNRLMTPFVGVMDEHPVTTTLMTELGELGKEKEARLALAQKKYRRKQEKMLEQEQEEEGVREEEEDDDEGDDGDRMDMDEDDVDEDDVDIDEDEED